MPRIKQQELFVISEQMKAAEERRNSFSLIKNRIGIPDPNSKDRTATQQCNSLIRELINRNRRSGWAVGATEIHRQIQNIVK